MAENVAHTHTKLAHWRDDVRIMALIGFAHMVSHFFHLIIAPVFPWLRTEFGYSYAELGFVMTVFFIVSGSFQALAGFVVDRFGALGTLIAGLLCLSLAAIGFGLSNSYPWLLAAAALAGLGNSVFHPVDFSLLNSKVSVPRLGSAYSVHGLTGSLGWGLAPVFLVGIATKLGWRAAMFAAAVLPLTVIVALLLNKDRVRQEKAVVSDRSYSSAHDSTLGFLRNAKVWWCFAFFVFVSAAIGAAQNFAPSIFTAIYALDLRQAALSVTTMMFASAFGMGIGGLLVSRSLNLERNITLALLIGMISALAIGSGSIHSGLALVLIGVMGFGIGLSGPSRDMLIRSVTPAGATGRVYGVVYSGLDLGIAIAPVVFGRMLDHGYFSQVFYGVAVCLLLSIVTAWWVTLGPSIDRTSHARQLPRGY